MTFRHLFSVLLFSILRFQTECLKKSICKQNSNFTYIMSFTKQQHIPI